MGKTGPAWPAGSGRSAAAISLLAWAVQSAGQALAALEPVPRGVLLVEMGHG